MTWKTEIKQYFKYPEIYLIRSQRKILGTFVYKTVIA